MKIEIEDRDKILIELKTLLQSDLSYEYEGAVIVGCRISGD